MMSTTKIANYISGLGNIDAAIIGKNYAVDVSFNTANTAISLLSGQIVNSNVYSMAPLASGNGFSLAGWFFPYSKQKSGALLVEIDNSNGPIAAVYMTGGTATSLNANFNGVTVTTDPSNGMVVPNAWNFFCYTVECSGNTAGTAKAIQSLYLNGGSSPMTNLSATYVSLPFITTYMGFGETYTTQFQGKMADMRCLQRVLSPMEITILSVCNNVGSAGALTIIPSVAVSNVSSVGLAVPFTVINTVAFSTASVFSYLTISRSPAFVSGLGTKTVLGSMLQHINGNWIWNDASVNGSSSYTYTITPYVNGTYTSAITTTLQSSAVYDFIAHNSYLYSAAGSNYYTYTGAYNETTYGLYNHIINITGNGTFTPNINITANVLIVGGGGAGFGGGGGGGGVGHGQLTFQQGRTYTITIGPGELWTNNPHYYPTGPLQYYTDVSGYPTMISGDTILEKAYGGAPGTGGWNIMDGGCGGGGNGYAPNGNPSVGLGGAGSLSYYGGNGSGAWNYVCGGGGGGGGNALNPISNNVPTIYNYRGGFGGAGGPGYTWFVNNATYAGGGGGYGSGVNIGGGVLGPGGGGLGGTGGGGNGHDVSGEAATFYGGGGGGGGYGPGSQNSGNLGGNGYQGIVVIAF